MQLTGFVKQMMGEFVKLTGSSLDSFIVIGVESIHSV